MARLLMKKSNMIYQYDDHNLVDQEVRASGVTFVMVRPARLAEGEAMPVKEKGELGKGVGLMGAITRKSVVGWLVDAVESEKWDNTAPVISN